MTWCTFGKEDIIMYFISVSIVSMRVPILNPGYKLDKLH